jgi:hypothetical protein
MSPLTRQKLILLNRFNLLVTFVSLASFAYTRSDSLWEAILYILLGMVGFFTIIIVIRKATIAFLLKRMNKSKPVSRKPPETKVLIRVQDRHDDGDAKGEDKMVFTVKPKKFSNPFKRR